MEEDGRLSLLSLLSLLGEGAVVVRSVCSCRVGDHDDARSRTTTAHIVFQAVFVQSRQSPSAPVSAEDSGFEHFY